MIHILALGCLVTTSSKPVVNKVMMKNQIQENFTSEKCIFNHNRKHGYNKKCMRLFIDYKRLYF